MDNGRQRNLETRMKVSIMLATNWPIFTSQENVTMLTSLSHQMTTFNLSYKTFFLLCQKDFTSGLAMACG